VLAASQAGSTYKVFTLAAALQRKVPFAYNINFPSAQFVAKALGYPDTRPVHNDSPSEHGTFNLQTATVQSVNTYFVALLASPYFNSDLSGPVQLAQSLGMSAHTLTPDKATDIIKNQRGSFTLGQPQTSPLDMANAFATIAANGKMCQPSPTCRSPMRTEAAAAAGARLQTGTRSEDRDRREQHPQGRRKHRRR